MSVVDRSAWFRDEKRIALFRSVWGFAGNCWQFFSVSLVCVGGALAAAGQAPLESASGWTPALQPAVESTLISSTGFDDVVASRNAEAAETTQTFPYKVVSAC